MFTEDFYIAMHAAALAPVHVDLEENDERMSDDLLDIAEQEQSWGFDYDTVPGSLTFD